MWNMQQTETIEETNELDNNDLAHIVKVPFGKDAQAYLLQARIEGRTVVALCGWKWIPARDPHALPVCDVCKEIYGLYRMERGGLPEEPGS